VLSLTDDDGLRVEVSDSSLDFHWPQLRWLVGVESEFRFELMWR
jgi:hypothetical protein